MHAGHCVCAFLVLLHNILAVNSSCVKEEGNQFNLTANSNSNSKTNIIWKRNGLVYSTCYLHGCQCYPQTKPRYSVTVSCVNDDFSSVLTIESVSRHSSHNDSATWSAEDGGTILSRCDPLVIYAKPENSTCSVQQLKPGDDQLSMTCVTKKVFPKANCLLYNSLSMECVTNKVFPEAKSQLYNGTSNGNRQLAADITCSHENTNTDPVYFKSTCRVNIGVSTLGVGQHQLFVKMFPDVTNGWNIGYTDSDTMNVILAYPQIAVSSNCFNGSNVNGNSIKTGTISSCTCTMINTGNPPGQIQWYRDSTPVGSIVSDGSVTYTITEENTDVSKIYYCEANSALNGNIRTDEIQREFAYGPGPVTLLTDGNDSYDFCPDDSPIVLTVSCQVSIDSVKPQPDFFVSFDNHLPTSRQNLTTDKVYKGDYTFNLNTGGIHLLMCQVVNSAFNDLKNQNSKYITVTGPPNTDPIIKIGDVLYSGLTSNGAVVNSDMTISCYTKTGYPPPVMKLWCESDSDYFRTSQDKTELYLKFEAKKKSDKCFCNAAYMSFRCPTNQTSSITLIFSSLEESATDETAAIGGYIGLIGVPLIVLVLIGILVYIILKKTGKLTACGRPSRDQKQKQVQDKDIPEQNFESPSSMSHHSNEAFDGYEIPVNVNLTNVEDKTEASDRLDRSKPTEKGDGSFAYENIV